MKNILIKIRRYVGLILSVIIMFVIGTITGGILGSCVVVDEFRQLSNAEKGIEIE